MGASGGARDGVGKSQSVLTVERSLRLMSRTAAWLALSIAPQFSQPDVDNRRVSAVSTRDLVKYGRMMIRFAMAMALEGAKNG